MLDYYVLRQQDYSVYNEKKATTRAASIQAGRVSGCYISLTLQTNPQTTKSD
jgi:hypothetical protein